jgi:hypothetical protein
VAALEEDVSELLHVRLIGAFGLTLDLVTAGQHLGDLVERPGLRRVE